MNRTLAICPTCAWPILAEVGQCVRCRPFVAPESADEASLTANAEIARNVTGQMPSMAVFAETQQVSAAEKQSELAWQQAQRAVEERRSRAPIDRLPMVVAVLVVVAVIGAFFVLRRGGNDEPSLTTPSNDLPWRSVVISGGSTIELPGAPVTSSTISDFGPTSRTSTSVPGAAIAVTVNRGDFGMRGAGVAAVEVLKARATELGDDVTSGRIKPNRDRWGDAYDLVVIVDEPIARLRAIVVGAKLFVIELVGPQTERTGEIFSRVVNSFTPSS